MKPYHHGDLRAQIILEAQKIIEEDGTGALSVRRISRNLGVTHSAPYAHFKDLEEIIAGLKQEGFAQLLEEVKALSTLHKDFNGYFKALSQCYVSFAQENPAKFEIMFHKPMGTKVSKKYSFVQTGLDSFKEAKRAMIELSGNPQKAEQVLLMGWSALHGLCSLRVGGTMHHALSVEDNFEQTVEKMVSSILSTATTR